MAERRRSLTAQVHWRATLEDLGRIDLICRATEESQSELLRRLVAEEARRLGLAAAETLPSEIPDGGS